jgi:hypothetical protein
MWKEEVVAEFGEIYRNLTGVTDENHETALWR